MSRNEVEEFLKDTEANPDRTDILEQPLIPEATEEEPEAPAPETEGDDEEGAEAAIKPKNRRERRLLARLQAERESSMFLAGKLEARTEAQRAVSEEADYLAAIERIYGTDSPEAQLATDILKKAIVGARDDAEERAYQRIRAEQEQMLEAEAEAEAEAEDMLDSMIEEIEESYGVSLTASQERAYFQLMQKMSPKDGEGNVIEYADPHAVWEVFEERLKPRTGDTSRAKSVASRSMTQSGASRETNPQEDVMARYLAEQGII